MDSPPVTRHPNSVCHAVFFLVLSRFPRYRLPAGMVGRDSLFHYCQIVTQRHEG